MLYAPLHVHSWYSLLEGVDSPEQLVRQAAACGYRSLALTDTNALYGVVAFRDAAAHWGVRPIMGATLDVAGQRCVALVADRTGYENLCRLITAIQLGQESTACDGEEARRSWTSPLARLIPPLAGGLHVLTANCELAESLCRHMERDRLWLELVRPGTREHEWRMWRLHERLGIQLVASTNVHFATPGGFERHRLVTAMRQNTLLEKVASGARPADPGHFADALGSVGNRFDAHARAASDASGYVPLLAQPWHALHPPPVIEQLFADLPAALDNAAWLVDQCDPDVLPRGPFIPLARVTPGTSAIEHLWALCRQGLETRVAMRIGPHTAVADARARLEREMAIIARRNLADYFLVVREIVMFSRDRGLPVALRGSGGNCLTAYLIGVTEVDPLEYGLPMERFLHEGREDLPDLDIDFCWRVRDQVIDYVFERFGAAHTAMISSHITLQARSAFREVAKIHGLSEAEVSRVVEKLPERVEELMEGDENMESSLEPESIPWQPPAGAVPDLSDAAGPEVDLKLIVRQAHGLIGAPHHLSIHPGGVVITTRPIDCYVPLERAAKGVLITQFEKDAAEAVGLVKIDLLGNRSLSTVSEALRLARDSVPVGLRASLPETEGSSYQVPPHDDRTASLLWRGDTIGVGQLESPAMRHLLVMLRPRSLYDVMQALALIRPGAASIGCKEIFVERRQGLQPVGFVHPCLEPVLRETYGLMLYEDDAMHVVAAMTGLPLGEADRFRKGITKCKTDEDRERWSREFLRLAVRHGVPLDAAKEQWVHIAKFNAYSFCKSHAASYAQLAWAAAYLKAHHPLEFWVAALNNNQGLYEKRVYIEEAKRSGIGVLLPCVNRSGAEFTIDFGARSSWGGPARTGDGAKHRCSGHAKSGAIRIGLDQIAGLSERTCERILTEREQRPYGSLEDLLTRVPLGQEEAEWLIRSGALDFTGRPRPELMLESDLLQRRAAVTRGAGRGHDRTAHGLEAPTQVVMFGTAPLELPPLRDYSPAQRLRDEFELLRIAVGPHLMTVFRPLLPHRTRTAGSRWIDSRSLRRSVGRRVVLAGIVATARHVPTKNGDVMQFVTLEDEYGVFEVTLFPDLCSRLPYLRLGPYIVEGAVEDQLGVVTVTARRFQLLAAGSSAIAKIDPLANADRLATAQSKRNVGGY